MFLLFLPARGKILSLRSQKHAFPSVSEVIKRCKSSYNNLRDLQNDDSNLI